ncbi:MAG: hypothetical protein HOV80_32315, partial [Polyangiaceae bacterium]|nr:hypothetical protein [Polyangiaceae bacterium]
TAYYLLGTAALSTYRIVKSRMAIATRVTLILLCAKLCFSTVGPLVSIRTPTTLMVLLLVASSGIAILLGISAFRRAEIGFVALAPVLVGAASLIRGAGAVVSDRVTEIGADTESIISAYRFATILATVSLVLAVGAMGIACAWMIKRSMRAGGIVVGLILVASVIGAKLAALAPDDLEPISFVVLRRAVQHLLTRPAPLLPEALVMGITIATPLVSLAALLQRHAPSRLAAAVGLTVLAGSSADIPILGLGLACGALFLGVYAADPHGVSAAVSEADEKRKLEPLPASPASDAGVSSAPPADSEASLPP